MGQANHHARVLVVDDEEDVQQFVSLVLEDTGFDVDCARNSVEALKKVDVVHPDLIVLDLMRPGRDGWSMLERLHESSNPPRVVVLAAVEDAPLAKRAGAAACVLEPLLAGVLVKTCEDVLAA